MFLHSYENELKLTYQVNRTVTYRQTNNFPAIFFSPGDEIKIQILSAVTARHLHVCHNSRPRLNLLIFFFGGIFHLSKAHLISRKT